MNANFQSDKTLESYLGFLIDHDLVHTFSDLPINRCLEENKSSFARQIAKEAKNINHLPPNLRLASDRTKPLTDPSLAKSVYDELKTITSLEAFYDYLENALENDLKTETKNKIVFGRGHHTPDILVITDIPSEEDSISKQILSGQSGQLMHKALNAIGLEDKAYFCPCLFWRPLGGRKISAFDIAQNAPLLESIVRITAPKAILLLGSVAANLVLNVEQTLTRIRGQVFQHTFNNAIMKLPIMVSFSPAFLLQQNAAKALFWRDLLTITDGLRKID